ncbi:hypothetical protein F5887DRAFT_1161416 [Amanita rubescens]|nr:hypothetical protein F5887DRAFT_1161416 [Amanita rubescens]
MTTIRCHNMICETIPSEILCEIFQLLCDKPISLHVLNNSSHFGEFPWAVGQVCRRWRDEFLSYPHLWTSLSLWYCFNGIQVDVDRLHEMSRRTLLYLERSKQLPLTITVCTVDDRRLKSIEKFPRTTWKLLLSCSERWERVDLALYHEPPLLDLFRCKMPIVKSLRLHEALIHSSYFELYHPFTSAPRLVELDIRWSEGWVFPWLQLTKVKIKGYIRSKELKTILPQLQNVEELRVGQVVFWDRDRGKCPFRLASLRLLAVQIYPLKILGWIEAPLLEHLWVDSYPMYDELQRSLIFAEELSLFIRRSSCHIRQLTLHNCLLSSVEVLCIKTTVYGHGSLLVEHITRMNDGVCLPNLRELEVTCLRDRGDEELMTAMSRLLEMRSGELRLIDVPLESIMVRTVSMSFK